MINENGIYMSNSMLKEVETYLNKLTDELNALQQVKEQTENKITILVSQIKPLKEQIKICSRCIYGVHFEQIEENQLPVQVCHALDTSLKYQRDSIENTKYYQKRCNCWKEKEGGVTLHSDFANVLKSTHICHGSYACHTPGHGGVQFDASCPGRSLPSRPGENRD